MHCITNAVTRARVSDALAAIGMQPILAASAEEVADVASGADALLLNSGTPSAERFAAMRAAAEAARRADVPVVLDPVGCGASAWRTEHIRSLAAMRVDVVRGNVAEVGALASIAGTPTLRGVSALAVDADVVERIATEAARRLQVVVLATGRGHDTVAGGTMARRCVVAGDVLSRVVGAGDVLSALIAAFLARGRAPFDAALEAHAAFAAAVGGAGVRGPGSFWPAFLDALVAHG